MPCSAGQNQWLKEIKGEKKEMGLWIWRMKWACAYTSVVLLTIIWSRRNEGGKHGFSLTHCCTAGGDIAAQGEQSAGKWHGVGGFFPCHALPGGAYVPLANTSWNIKGLTDHIFWFLIRYLQPEGRGIHIFFIFWSYIDYILNDNLMKVVSRSFNYTIWWDDLRKTNKNGLHLLSWFSPAT